MKVWDCKKVLIGKEWKGKDFSSFVFCDNMFEAESDHKGREAYPWKAKKGGRKS